MPGTTGAPFLPRGRYVLVQKNHTFLPHLQVIPVGGIVAFPNQDPFFHNVFSLFDGKRFNLGHYEAGSSRSVAFTRAGVSYIFCNIHPEMSAVIIALNTPLYAIADAQDTLVRRPIPPGDYRMHVWIEGVPPSFLEQLTRTVRLGSGKVDLGPSGLRLPRLEPDRIRTCTGSRMPRRRNRPTPIYRNGVRLRTLAADLFDELGDLGTLAVAQVEEADADLVAVVEGLDDAAETEGKAFEVELGFDAGVDADGEALAGEDAAAGEAEIEDAALDARTDFDKEDGGGGVDRVAGVGAAVGG